MPRQEPIDGLTSGHRGSIIDHPVYLRQDENYSEVTIDQFDVDIAVCQDYGYLREDVLEAQMNHSRQVMLPNDDRLDDQVVDEKDAYVDN